MVLYYCAYCLKIFENRSEARLCATNCCEKKRVKTVSLMINISIEELLALIEYNRSKEYESSNKRDYIDAEDYARRKDELEETYKKNKTH